MVPVCEPAVCHACLEQRVKKELGLALICEDEQIVLERLAPDETPPGSSHAAAGARPVCEARGAPR